MRDWQSPLRYNPLPGLLSHGNVSINYFSRRDLLDQKVGHVNSLWELPGVTAEINRQKPDGSWKYGVDAGRGRENYDLLETYRIVGRLVEKYGMHKQHSAIKAAAEYIFSCQTAEGDFRGIYGTQYSPNYSAAITEILIKAGYERDKRITKSLNWLLTIRQDDGGWAIPLRTHPIKWDDTDKMIEPLEPIRTKPFSHLVTGMVLRAFAAHSKYRGLPDIKRAGKLLLSRFFSPDKYADRRNSKYWETTSFPFWFTDVVSALDSISIIGISKKDEQVTGAINWLADRQMANGTFNIGLLKAKDKDSIYWITLSICRILQRFTI